MDVIDSTTSDTVSPDTGADATPALPTGSPSPSPRNVSSDVHRQLKIKVSQWRRFMRDIIPEWSRSIDYRRAKPFETDSDMDRVAITADWANTKDKHASLFSQVPQVRLTPRRATFKGAVPIFARALNDTLRDSEVGTAMNECFPDVINAAGIGIVHIAYETRTEMRDLDMAKIRSQVAPPAMAAPAPGQPAPAAPPQIVQLPYSTAKRFVVDRVSPADLICDMAFMGSDFNKSSLIGRRGRMRWSQALLEFGQSAERPNGLTLDDKGAVCGKDTRNPLDRLNPNADKERYIDTEIVTFDEVFYRRFKYHTDERSFDAIQRVVFVHGRTESPAIDELWKGQQRIENDGIIGSCLYPIQVLTLTYMSDEAIPPSDTAMGRPQVDELIESRSQQMLQRRFSIPIRSFDNNRVPPEIVTLLMRGQWQGMIPVNGRPEGVFDEVARASYPPENSMFDHNAKAELDAAWGIGGGLNGGGAGNTQIRSATEARAVAGKMNTRNTMERALGAGFFCRIAQVTAGLVSLFGEFTPEEEAQLKQGGWDKSKLAAYFTYDIRVDATVLLDAEQQYQRLEALFNIGLKSGYLDPMGPLSEMNALAGGKDEWVRAPEPKAPEPISISLRISGAEDLQDPMLVALLAKTGQLPTPEDLASAQKYIIASKQLPPPPAPAPPAGPPDPSQPPPQDQPTTATSGDAHPNADMAGKVEKRMQDGR